VIVLVVAVAARALLVPGAPTLSDDAYRFVWDGRVQAAGFNPYRYVPADRHLLPLRDWQVFTRVNRPHTRALYPPASEVTFLAAHEVAGDGMVPWKLSMLALEAAAVALLLGLLTRARVSHGRVVLYAWHPIAIVEIAGSGHPDPIMLVPLLATLLLWDAHRRVAAGVALGVALPDPRCVMPSLEQEDLPKDSRILKALAQHNRIDVAGSLYPCAGVYAVAEATGGIRRDDRVSLA